METEEEIVISGIAGHLPECENIEQFWEALYEGKDLLTVDDRRYPPGFEGTPERTGKIRNTQHFDATFFGCNPKLTNFMDPRQRILLETTYECIVDAGYNPEELRGTRTGVYVAASSYFEVEEIKKMETEGNYVLATYVSMAANRTSFAFDFKGPSYTCDSACSSSVYAIVNAVKDLQSGVVDYALVGTTQINFDPHLSLEYQKLKMTSQGGISKSFNVGRDGFARSEGIVTILLQKKRNCRRAYAVVTAAVANSDGYKKEGITFPSPEGHSSLLKAAYENSKISPNDITYFEAHGTGTRVGDLVECTVLHETFGCDRDKPLLIGSVKGNMGHSEVSAGLCSLIKILAIVRTGIIPKNINSEPVDNTLPGIINGTLQVVTRNTPFDHGLIGLSALGFGGANAHIVIKPCPIRNKEIERSKYRLVLASGVTPEAVDYFLNGVYRNHDDLEFLALVDEIHKININGHRYRGYVVLGDEPATETNKFISSKPVWFIYTGMGCQWTAMGRELLNIDVFRKSFQCCAEILELYGIDLYHIVTSDDPKVYDKLAHSFVAICAIQIALTDIVHVLGIYPDGIAGHSMGEIACGYADGTVTREEAILCAYARGHACDQMGNTSGVMAAVELSKEEILPILPKGVYIGCQNSSTSVTITGLEEYTLPFVQDLKSKGIFATVVNTQGMAFHSVYVHEAGKLTLNALKEIIKVPKRRSSKWISSSVPDQEKPDGWSQYNGPEYHYNNLVNPVLFDKVLEKIPKNSVVIEIAPHGLLQAILKKELPSVTNITLVNKRSDDIEKFFLSSIGQLYITGCQPQLRNFYHEISLPVSPQTATISPLVKWDHSVSWLVPKYNVDKNFSQFIVVNTSEAEWSYLQGHVIGGRVLMPAATYAMLAWKMFSKMYGKSINEVSVVMERLSFKRATVIISNTDIKFYVTILKQTGDFEITESNSLVATGNIKLLDKYLSVNNINQEAQDSVVITKSDFYKEMLLRKYNYTDLFRSLTEYNYGKNEAKIVWCEKYDCFLDGLIQINVLNYLNNRDLLLPTFIEKLVIDPKLFLKETTYQREITVTFDKRRITKCNGFEMYGVVLTKTSTRYNEQRDPILEIQDFVNYNEKNVSNNFNSQMSLIIAIEIVIQNCHGIIKELKICEIITENSENQMTREVSEILSNKPLVTPRFVQMKQSEINEIYDVILTEDFTDSSILEHLHEDGFVIHKGSLQRNLEITIEVVFRSRDITILRKCVEPSKDQLVFIEVENSNFNWLDDIKTHIKGEKPKVVYLISQNNSVNGVMGLINCLNKEPSCCKFRCVSTDERISIREDIFRKQIKKNLVYNILKDRKWGTYVYLPFESVDKREVTDAIVDVATVGNLSSLKWFQSQPICHRSDENTGEAHIFYSSLNFRDVMLATGKIQYFLPDLKPTDSLLGLDFSGVMDGKRVMGICNYNGIALQCKVDRNLTWEIPSHWSLEDAATVPLIFATAYYSLIMRGQLQPGESLLIHAGAGATGMAAISVALSLNCEVFTTVSTNKKKQFLKQRFPQLKDENFGNSRDKSFEALIMEKTEGRGVDVVLNSLAGELFEASLRCLAEGGRFLELGKVDFFNRKLLDSYQFLRNCSFHGIILEHVFYGKNQIPAKTVQSLVAEGLRTGVVKPLPRTVFSDQEIEEAFRFLSSGKHLGKVLINIREENAHILESPKRTISASPRIFFDPQKSYLITGGLGGVGLELANWMIKKGATNLVLNSRRGVRNRYQAFSLKKWKDLKGIEVLVSTEDSSEISEASKVLEAAERLAPVGGIFNLAVELRDKLVTNQSLEDFQVVFKSKVKSVTNLDQITRIKCKQLDHFVVFSSISGGFGNPGQTNYGMANSILDRICEKRKIDGFPGLAVQYGLIGEVGLANNLEKNLSPLQFNEPQTITSSLNALEKFMLQSYPVVMSMVRANKDEEKVVRKERTPAETVAHILGLKNASTVDTTLNMVKLGMDSLMSAEIKQILYKEYHIDKDTQEIQDLTFEDLLNFNSENLLAQKSNK